MKYKNNQKINPRNRTKLIVVTALVLVLLIGATSAWILSQNRISDSGTETENGLPERTINLDPPTEEERASGDRHKETLLDNDQGSGSNNAAPSKTASVIITDAGQYDGTIEVRSFIPDHYEDGTCTITFRRNNQTVFKNTPAYRDASTTICTNPLFERSEFPSAGDWQVTVSYKSKSGSATGQSEQRTVTIN